MEAKRRKFRKSNQNRLRPGPGRPSGLAYSSPEMMTASRPGTTGAQSSWNTSVKPKVLTESSRSLPSLGKSKDADSTGPGRLFRKTESQRAALAAARDEEEDRLRGTVDVGGETAFSEKLEQLRKFVTELRKKCVHSGLSLIHI